MLELTDENFEREIKNSPKPVLVDFFAEWCTPCSVIAPILEKLSQEFEEKFVLAKANLNNVPLAAQKFGVDAIPSVMLFRDGETVSGFVGLYPEPVIRQWLEEKLKKGKEKDGLGKITQESEEYAKQNGFWLNPNRGVVERIINGLIENEKKYGKRYCPCRRITGNREEDAKNVCPCVWHRQEIEKEGHCLCGLFIK